MHHVRLLFSGRSSCALLTKFDAMSQRRLLDALRVVTQHLASKPLLQWPPHSTVQLTWHVLQPCWALGSRLRFPSGLQHFGTSEQRTSNWNGNRAVHQGAHAVPVTPNACPVSQQLLSHDKTYFPDERRNLAAAGSAWNSVFSGSLAGQPQYQQQLAECALQALATVPLTQYAPAAALHRLLDWLCDPALQPCPHLPKAVLHALTRWERTMGSSAALGTEHTEAIARRRGILKQIASQLTPLTLRFSHTEAAALLRILSKYFPEASQSWSALAAHLATTNACQVLPATTVLSIMQSCTALGLVGHTLWAQAVQALQHRVSQLPAVDLPRVLWCVSQSRTPQLQLLASVGQAAIRQQTELGGQAAALLAWHTVRLADPALRPLLEATATSLVTARYPATLQQTSIIAYAATLHKCAPLDLYAFVASRVTQVPSPELASLSAGEQVRLLWALSQSPTTIRHVTAERRMLACVEGHAQSRQLDPRDACLALQACQHLQHRDPDLISRLVLCMQPVQSMRRHEQQTQRTSLGQEVSGGAQQQPQGKQRQRFVLGTEQTSRDHETQAQHAVVGPLGPVMVAKLLRSLTALQHSGDQQVVEQQLLSAVRALKPTSARSVTQLAHLVNAAAGYQQLSSHIWCEMLLTLHQVVTLQSNQWGARDVVECLKGLAAGTTAAGLSSPSQHLAIAAVVDLAQQRLHTMSAAEVLEVSRAVTQLRHVPPVVHHQLFQRVAAHAESPRLSAGSLSSLLLAWVQHAGVPEGLSQALDRLLPRLPRDAAVRLCWYCVLSLEPHTARPVLESVVHYCSALVSEALLTQGTQAWSRGVTDQGASINDQQQGGYPGTMRRGQEVGGQGTDSHVLTPVMVAQLACIADACLEHVAHTAELLQLLGAFTGAGKSNTISVPYQKAVHVVHLLRRNAVSMSRA